MQCRMTASRPGGVLVFVAAVLVRLAAAVPADALPAQDTPAPRKLGVFLWHDSPNDLATLAGIRAALQQAGLPHVFVDHRAGSDPDRAKAALQALQAAHCDLVFALGTQAALLAKDAIVDVPVVFAAVSDPVASGVVSDWGGSGNNLCGCSNWIAPANVLDVFRLAVPGCRRLGVIRSRVSAVVSTAEVARMRTHLAAANGDLTLHEAVARDADHIGEAIAELLAADVDAIWIPIDITIYQNVAAVRQALGARRIPLLTTAAAGVRNGAHVGAAVDYELHGRRAAAMAVDVLVHGKATGTIPVDRMKGTQVTVNLGIARRDGIDLPLSLLALADDVLTDEPRERKADADTKR